MAANQWVTAYFSSASEALLRKLAKQQFRHISIFEDAASVSTHEVRSLGFVQRSLDSMPSITPILNFICQVLQIILACM